MHNHIIYNFSRNGFFISTDKSKLDLQIIHQFLSNQSYWAKEIPMETVKLSIENSLCFGVYNENHQIGFARVITDFATFAYLADVFVLENFRGIGLSKWLMEIILALPELQNLRRWSLATRDAHSLYEKSGFTSLSKPEIMMEKYIPDFYLRNKK